MTAILSVVLKFPSLHKYAFKDVALMPKCNKCGRWRPFSFQLNNGLCTDCFAGNYKARVSEPEVPLDQEPPIPESEKRFYKPDDYYTETDLAGNKVIPFEERQNGCKSKNGLYPAEILLLHYCSLGQYPCPAKGYPAFWWFEYGIRNVSYVLKTLENRGFIEYGSLSNSVAALTTAQLKRLLKDVGASTAGNKEYLVGRVRATVSDDVLWTTGLRPKYKLTQLGAKELKENPQVADMRKCNSTEKEREEMCELMRDYPDKRYSDLQWGEYNRKSMEYAQHGQWGLYRNIRLDMFLHLYKETRYLDSFFMLSEVFLFDLNGESQPFLAPGIIQYAQRNWKKLNANISEIYGILNRRLLSYTPFHTFSPEEVAGIFLLFAIKRDAEANYFVNNRPANIKGKIEKIILEKEK